jgi:hypothetical protein
LGRWWNFFGLHHLPEIIGQHFIFLNLNLYHLPEKFEQGEISQNAHKFSRTSITKLSQEFSKVSFQAAISFPKLPKLFVYLSLVKWNNTILANLLVWIQL